MKQKVTMIIGVPAVGKSALVRALLRTPTPGSWNFYPQKWTPYHGMLGWGIQVLGDYRDQIETYPGTDKYSMAVQPHVIQKIINSPHNDFIFEGDRLGNDKMIKQLQYVDCDFEVIELYTTPEILASRRARRDQSEKFQRSRETKIKNMTGPEGRLARTGNMPRRFAMHSMSDLQIAVRYLVDFRL